MKKKIFDVFKDFLIKKGLQLLEATSMRFGGADEDRTRDLLHAMEALSQLSYGPKLL
jgi:hypothetical protein